jgi:aminomethyltransferase
MSGQATSQSSPPAPPRRTRLYGVHVAAGAKMVPFAGYEMPVNYPAGVLKEHLWTREKAGLFDVSHMGLGALHGPDHETTARALEAMVPADLVGLAPGQQRYSQLLAADGGILDDLMITRPADPSLNGTLLLVVNAACKWEDWAHIGRRLPAEVSLALDGAKALVALQGPAAARVLARHLPGAAEMGFMTARTGHIGGMEVHVSRSGYTGEDGYEIAFPGDGVTAGWQLLAGDPEVQPIGLGARDSLRLEAGLCLYGHDIDTTTSPIEAGLSWSIQKRRRLEGGFPGAARIQRELAEGPARRRVGIKPEGRAPAREGTVVLDAAGREIGVVTSGGFGPTVGGPVAMGYVTAESAEAGTPVQLVVRGKPLPGLVAALPFSPHRYHRKA